MDDHIMVCVKFRAHCKLIPVHQSTTWSEFSDSLCMKWGELVGKKLSCTCSVASLTDVSLESDDDLTNLFLVCKMAKAYTVNALLDCEVPHVSFSPVSSSTIDVVYRMPCCSHSSPRRSDPVVLQPQSNLLITDGRSSEFEWPAPLPTYDVCPAVKRKPMLSDGWSDLSNKAVGQVFRGGAAEFRVELIKYSARMGFKFVYKRNDSRYIHAECCESQNTGCEWFVKAKRLSITSHFELSHANFIHKCVGKLVGDNNKRLDSKIMGRLLLPDVKSHPNISGKKLIHTFKHNYGFQVPYWKAHRAAEIARSEIYGSFNDSYDDLRWYTAAIQQSMPGSVVVLEANDTSHQFERVFISYKACIDGFRSCRPMLFIDGTFMKGRAKGVLLSATAKDGNNGLFPVAFAVVSAENTDNWQWFLELIRDNVFHSSDICYVSDRNLGLLAAYPLVFGKVTHFFCLYHLLTNLRGRSGKGWTTKFRDKLGDYFTACAYAPTKSLFDDAVKKFKEVGGQIAEDWMEDLKDFDKWAVAHSPHVKRYGEMTSNAAESFNMWIKKSRSLPITAMLEDIRKRISKWYVERRQHCSTWSGVLVESKQHLWYYLDDCSRTWFVTLCPGGDFEVTSSPSVRIDLRSRECSCHQWQVTGFPCVHAAAVIRSQALNLLDHVDPCFYKESYVEAYKSNINPIPDTMKFEFKRVNDNFKILPPILNRPPGRPKADHRIPSYGETAYVKRAKGFKRKCADNSRDESDDVYTD